MSKVIESLEREQLRRVPRFEPGDRVRVHFQVVEGNRRRTQVFEGIVIGRQGSGVRETFTVRKSSFGVGVERTFPVHSPKIERIEVVSRGDVRRAKLYYLRGRVGKSARVRERQYSGSPQEPVLEATTAFDEQGAQVEAEVLPDEAPEGEPPEVATGSEPESAAGPGADDAAAETATEGADADSAEAATEAAAEDAGASEAGTDPDAEQQ